MVMKLDAEAAEAKARELLDDRIVAVRALVGSRQALADLQEQVEAAQSEDLRCYRAALNGGWSADELRKLGIDEPVKKRARKTPRTTPAKGGETSQSAAPSVGETSASQN